MSEPVSISAGVAARYAAALFELSESDGALARLEADVAALTAAMADSADLRAMVASPILTRDDQANGIGAVARAMNVSAYVANTLVLMAQKRRLYVLPQLLANLAARLAEARGEVTAEVASATPLTPAQAAELAATLSARVGKTVKLKTTVDGTLIGGLVVKVGSRMIDTSVRARLAALQNAMKEVR